MSMVEIDKNDIKYCANLLLNVFKEEPWCEKWDISDAEKRLDDIYNTPNFKGLMYVVDGKIIGCILGNIEYMSERKKFYLKEMFVDREHKCEGIGTTLLMKMEEQLRKDNVKQVFLFTRKNNLSNRFYKKGLYLVNDDMVYMYKKID